VDGEFLEPKPVRAVVRPEDSDYDTASSFNNYRAHYRQQFLRGPKIEPKSPRRNHSPPNGKPKMNVCLLDHLDEDQVNPVDPPPQMRALSNKKVMDWLLKQYDPDAMYSGEEEAEVIDETGDYVIDVMSNITSISRRDEYFRIPKTFEVKEEPVVVKEEPVVVKEEPKAERVMEQKPKEKSP
jgi:hypothetical protein